MGITSKDIAAHRALIERGEYERLRDTFAAAALTGLLSNVQRYQNGPLTEQAFEIAEFMLKERDRTSVGVAEMDSATDRKSAATPRACASSCSQPFDSAPTTHDAVPEAKATNDGGTPKDADGTGNTLTLTDEEREAIAAIVHDAMRFDREAKTPKWQAGNSNAESMARQAAWQIAGLLRATLTDEEREAVEDAVAELTPGAIAATLRKLLERLR
jgi:hypothetical protein